MIRVPVAVMLTALICVFSTTAALSEDRLLIAYNSSWPPYSSGQEGAVDGILPRLMSEILSKHMSVDADGIGLDWAQAQAYVRRGRADAMVTVATEKRQKYSVPSVGTVFTLRMQPVYLRGTTAESKLMADPTVATLRQLAVCDIAGNGWAENYYATNSVMYRRTANVTECLRYIENGRYEVLLQPREVALAETRRLKASSKLEVLPVDFATMEFQLLLSKKSNMNAEFIQRFDDVLKNIKESGEYERMYTEIATDIGS